MAYYEKQWPNPLAWPVYLTNLGYALLGVFSICDCVVTVYVHMKRPDILSGGYQKIKFINKYMYFKYYNKAKFIILYMYFKYYYKAKFIILNRNWKLV